MMYANVRVEGDLTPEGFESAFGLEDHGRVQKAIDTAVINYMLPYWGLDTGALANSAFAASDIGSGELVYDKDYAAEIYYGVRADGTPINYHLDHNPQAGPYPFERMVADHANDILEEAANVARSK